MDCSKMDMQSLPCTPDEQTPCKMDPLDCVKQMVCFGAVGLPTRSDDHTPVGYDKAVYWSVEPVRVGRSLAPEPFPPIAT